MYMSKRGACATEKTESTCTPARWRRAAGITLSQLSAKTRTSSGLGSHSDEGMKMKASKRMPRSEGDF
eukprot:scaffold23126_cov241-Isochrysis_galbana.AAC.10